MTAYLIDGAAGLLVAGLLTYGLVALCQSGLDKYADRRETPVRDADDAYFGAVAAGDPLSRRSRREIGRELALANRKASARATVASIARHYRRHSKGGAR